jgi:hypothetical protein
MRHMVFDPRGYSFVEERLVARLLNEFWTAAVPNT